MYSVLRREQTSQKDDRSGRREGVPVEAASFSCGLFCLFLFTWKMRGSYPSSKTFSRRVFEDAFAALSSQKAECTVIIATP
ncbi:unnamed protein product [Scytosiphon promiscuus]